MQQTICAQDDPGARIYERKCASCHGVDGQGVADGHQEPLRGSESVGELAQLIEETMPDESPEECVGEEALQVARYIHKQFYSQDDSGDAARMEMARLTVDQYRNAVADVIGRFAPTKIRPEPSSRRRRGGDSDEVATKEFPPGPGLRGTYFQSKGMSKADKLVRSRIDGRVAFNFDEGSPVEGITADQFSIIWDGGLIANETGYYEFRVSTQNGARLYLNLDPREILRKLRDDSSAAGQTALIDGWVSSGKMRELTARVFLLGGRVYPLRLEFFKYLEKTASIKFEWKPPQGVWSTLDHNFTTTGHPPRVFVCKTPFPADDRSLGYERGSSVSEEWQIATMNAAIEASDEVVERLPLLADYSEDTDDRETPIKEFVKKFAAAAYRRPLLEPEEESLLEIAFLNTPNLETGVRRAIVMILMSPQFLYTDLTAMGEPPSPYTVASRLSFGLWDSIPDRQLLEAADAGELATFEQIAAQARRMLSDSRAKAKMRSFFHEWLELEYRDLAKDRQMFPEFDERVVADLRRSLDLFIDGIVWSPQSDYRELLLADYLVLNRRLRNVYLPNADQDAPEPSPPALAKDGSKSGERFVPDFQRVSFPKGQRSGVLTHPYLLSAFAYHNNTSPIHRGVFLTRNIVGRELNPPPMAVAFKNDEFSPELTMREKITQLTRDKACMACHSVINPLGFSLENFDAVGRWRSIDNNKPVDTTSKYETESGELLEISSARDVAQFAVSSESAHRAFITQVFQYIVKQNPYAIDPELTDRLAVQFAEDDFHVQNLWARIAAIAAAHNPTVTTVSTNQGLP